MRMRAWSVVLGVAVGLGACASEAGPSRVASRPVATKPAPTTASTAPAPAPVVVLRGAGFEVASTRFAGFEPFGNPGHVEGPIPGMVADYQTYLNTEKGQRVTVSYVRNGLPLAEKSGPEGTTVRLPDAVNGRPAFKTTNSITGQTGVGIALDETTVYGVMVDRMTDEELFALATSLQVSSRPS